MIVQIIQKIPQQQKTGEHIPCGYLMTTIWAFINIENQDTLYPGEDSIKIFCQYLREHAKNIIDYEKKQMLPLRKEDLKSINKQSISHLWKKIFKKVSESINYRKFRDHCHYREKFRGPVHAICNLKYNVLNGISVVFHNG